ncbi:hypothetical protein BKF12_003306 [Escherichia coli]|nr:hypothetical protein [Escherichia coli]EET3360567.1 hypothetical protein [Escherichia coli]EEZ6528412.1 hypothetical protein [Escherichia coli]EEZ8454958.1 hypothetical protein [Escherichia coli]EEZ9347162.1 hypothetical protein [Escherichia coli]
MSQHTDTSNLEIISTAIETLRTQIALIQKRNPGDDLSKRLHESVIATTDNLVAEINKLLDDGAVDYNKLVDQFEEYQQAVNDGLIRFSQVTGVSATVESLGDAVNQFAANMRNEIGNLEARLEQANTLRKSAEADLNRYKKDYPPSLTKRLDVAEKDNRTLKRERRELKERLTKLNQQCIDYQGEGVTLRKKLATAQSIIETLKRECSQLGHDLNRACGMGQRPETFPLMYDGRDAIAYIHEYPHGLVAETGQRGEALLTANYHQQIRTNRLLTMDVIPSVWGTPLYYRLPGFEKDWNTDIDECLADKIMAYLETDFPRLYRRIMDSKDAPIDELKMRPETLEAIKQTEFETVFSVACIPSCFHESIPFMQGDRRQEIIDACRVWANEWDKKNGGVEDLYGK